MDAVPRRLSNEIFSFPFLDTRDLDTYVGHVHTVMLMSRFIVLSNKQSQDSNSTSDFAPTVV